MEAISGNNKDPFDNIALTKRKASTVVDKSSINGSYPSGSVSLTDLSSITDRIANSSTDIRPEAIERAQLLMSDPNWPHDSDIDKLAIRLLNTEDFS